jgi:hypothetical protein
MFADARARIRSNRQGPAPGTTNLPGAEEGLSLRAIAAQVRVSPMTVQRIVAAAKEERGYGRSHAGSKLIEARAEAIMLMRFCEEALARGPSRTTSDMMYEREIERAIRCLDKTRQLIKASRTTP